MRKGLLILCICFWAASLSAQTTTVGRDFWMTFLCNAGDQNPNTTSLMATGDSNATITVTNLQTGWSTTENLTANQSVQIDVPLSSATTTSSNTATTKNCGLHVTSTASITLYAKNYRYRCNDATLIYPTAALGTHYIMQDYPTDPSHTSVSGAMVGFVATSDSTTLTMALPCTLLNNSAYGGDTLTINLMQGESYQLIAASPGTFSGMEVRSNGKAFAAFQGNRCAYIPIGSSGADFVYEQAVPVEHWGKEYVVTTTYGRSTDQVRITSSEDGCQVYSNGNYLGTLQKGETVENTLAGATVCHYICTKKACVGKYLRSASSGGSPGDPSSVIIPPVQNGLPHIRFSTYGSYEFTSYYINIIAHNSFTAGIALDGNSIGNQFTSIDTAYSIARISVTNSTHLLESPLGPIVAETYGLGDYSSHAFVLGRSFGEIQYDSVDIYDTVCLGQAYNSHGVSLPQTETVGDMTLTSLIDTTCYFIHLTVLPTASSDVYDSIAPGDTMIWNGIEVTSPGEYTATLTSVNGCDSVVTLHLFYAITNVNIYDTLCSGGAYLGGGFSISAVTGDTVLTRDTVEQGIPMHYILHLTALPTQHTEFSITIIIGDSVTICDTVLRLAGSYTFHYTAANGCDSTVAVFITYEAVGVSASATGVCPGEEVVITASGTHTFIWAASPSDPEVDAQQGMNPITVHPTQITTYSLLGEAGNVLASVTVGTDVAPALCVEVNRDILDFDNPSLLFTDCSERRSTTTWDFADGRQLSGQKVRRRYDYPLPDSAVVTMTTCNRYNCCADTTVAIPMKILSVWFPNVFTPGQDNNNLFQCFTSMDVAVFELVIYNRWGLLVWRSDDASQGWDGRRTDGIPCPQGAYAYKYYLRSSAGTVRTGTGTVTLLR